MEVAQVSAEDAMNLPAGALAPPGIYVVSHRDPAHAVPHEIIIDLPMILPCCRLCRNVRFSQKSSIPQHIEGHDLFCGKLLPRQSNSRSEIQAFIEASRRQLSASREALHRSVEVLHEHKVTIINSRLPNRNGTAMSEALSILLSNQRRLYLRQKNK